MVAEWGTGRTAVRRHPERGRYDRETVFAIVDEAPICHVAVVRDGAPVVLPTIHVRLGEVLYLHGSPAAGMLRDGRRGVEVSAAFTLLDGLVLPRSARNHSMNYRSAVVFGPARRVVEREEKWAALEAVTNKVVPGRWDVAQRPTEEEFREVEVVAVQIEEASAKVRTAPVTEDETGGAVDCWAGVIPLTVVRGEGVPAPFVADGVAAPVW